MVQFTSLLQYIEYTGYPRYIFEELCSSTDNLQKRLEWDNQGLTRPHDVNLEDGFYVCGPRLEEGNDSGCNAYLIKVKEGSFKCVENYNKKHLINSIIRNILLQNYITDVGCNDSVTLVKAHALIYTAYYFVYSICKSVPNIKNITENVKYLLGDIIKVMIDKELTLYRNHLEIGEFIDIMQVRMNIEVFHNKDDGRHGINLHDEY